MANEGSPAEKFEIQHYELHVGTAEVEAASEAEAIKRFLSGDGNAGIGSEYAGPCEAMGMPLDQHPELAQALQRLGVQFRDVLPTIHSVRRLQDAD